jgi:hypothetical protein
MFTSLIPALQLANTLIGGISRTYWDLGKGYKS